MARWKGRGSSSPKRRYSKDNLSIISNPRASKEIKMGFTKEPTKMGKDQVSASSFGRIMKPMKVSGEMGERMGMGFGGLPRVTITKANGKKTCRMERESIFTRVVQFIVDISKTR